MCKVSVSIVDIDVCSSGGGGGGFSAFKRHFGFAVIYRELTPKSYSMSPTHTHILTIVHTYYTDFILEQFSLSYLKGFARGVLCDSNVQYENGFIIHYSIAFINFSRNFSAFVFIFFSNTDEMDGKLHGFRSEFFHYYRRRRREQRNEMKYKIIKRWA